MQNILVTGATSMIGSALIRRALQDPTLQKIYAVVRSQSQKLNRLPKDSRIHIIECDTQQYSSLPHQIQHNCDTFFHFAWPRTPTYQESYEDISNKTKALQAVLEAVKAAAEMGCSKFIGAGSQTEYGIVPNGKITSNTPCHPVRADGILHLAAGQLANITAQHLGIDCIWMRIFSVYGRQDRPNSMIQTTLQKLIKGEPCSFTPCEQIWDYLHEDDIGNAFYCVGKHVQGSHVYCVGNGDSKPLRQYLEMIQKIVAPSVKLGFGQLPYPPNAVMNLNVDVSDLQKDAHWKPQISFEEGIRDLYQFLKNQSKT